MMSRFWELMRRPIRRIQPAPPQYDLKWWKWTDRDTLYGWVHRADESSVRYRPGVLFVFVHGILSGTNHWSHYVPLLFEKADTDIDVLAFRYRSWPFQSGGNRAAANLLDRAIATSLQGRPKYRHIVLFTHSNGGLVCKQYMIDQSKKWQNCHFDRASDCAAVGNVRRIINAGTPHRGGRFPFNFFAGCASAVQTVCFPASWFISLFSLHKIPAGFNTISLTLTGWGLRKLNASWSEFLNSFYQQDVPIPQVHEIAFTDDIIAAGLRANDLERIAIQGNYSEESCQQIHTWDPVRHPACSSQINETIASFRDELLSWIVAERIATIARHNNQQLGCMELRGPTTKQQSGEQRQVFEYLKHYHRNIQKVVVTGPMLVGKSRLISRLAQHLACERLRSFGNGGRRNVAMLPLNLFNLSEVFSDLKVRLDGLRTLRFNKAVVDGRNEVPNHAIAAEAIAVMELVLGGWIRFSEGVIREPQVSKIWMTMEQVQRSLNDADCTVIVDSVDEFASKYEIASWTIISAFERFLQNSGRNHTLILGMREGTADLNLLESQGWTICRIEASRVSENKKLARIVELVRQHPIPGDLQIEYENLVYSQYGTLLEQHADEYLLEAEATDLRSFSPIPGSAGHLLSFIIRKMLGSDEDLRLAMKLVARAFYGDDAPQMTISRIREKVRKVVDAWEGKDLAEIQRRLKRCLNNPRFPENVLRTVFRSLPGAEETWSFSHVLWRDFLVADYFAECIKSRNFGEIGEFGYSPSVTGLAGHLLGRWEVDETFVSEARELSRSQANLFYLCNADAIAVWNPKSVLSAGVVGEFCRSVLTEAHSTAENSSSGETPTATVKVKPVDCAFTRVFLMNSLVFRVLAARKRLGNGAFDQKDERFAGLIAKFIRNELSESSSLADPFVRCAAWCHLKSLDPDAAFEWPTFKGTQKEFEPLGNVWMMHAREEWMLESLQRSLVSLVKSGLQRMYATRRVATVFYLLMLSDLFYRQLTIPAAEELLYKVFSPGSDFEISFKCENSELYSSQASSDVEPDARKTDESFLEIGGRIPQLWHLFQVARNRYSGDIA